MDVGRIKKLAIAEAETSRGRLFRWWRQRYETADPERPFGQQTIGGLLRQFYTEIATELSRLRGQLRADGEDQNVEVRVADLEQLLSDADSDLQGLDTVESTENWLVPRKTGDPLADKWEAAIARGETPDLDEAP